MNSPATSNFHPLHDQLALEVLLAEPNSSRSQLPILNLLSSLRDEAPSVSQQAALAAAARSVENALLAQRPWSEQDLEQLNQLLARLQDAATNPAVTFDDLTLFAEEMPPGETGSPASPAAAVTGPEFEELVTPDFARNGAFLKQFSEESGEHLAIIEQTVLVLEDQPADRDALDAIFRGFHTIKGNASFLELRNVQQLAHGLEGLLDLARLGKFAITPAAITLILETQDALKRFLEELDRQSAAGGSGAPIHLPVAALLQRKQQLISTPAAQPTAFAGEPRQPVSPARASRSGPLKVDREKLDLLLEMVGELVISQSQVLQDPEFITTQNERLQRNFTDMRRVTKRLHKTAMSLRMTPVGPIFDRMKRLVRDLALRMNKEVELQLEGSETEFDRTMVEDLADPLLHMVRNALDHGLEPPAERLAAGKPARGCLRLRARHQHGSVVIELSDDGRGLAEEMLIAKAVARGMITPETRLSRAEAYQLIFASGFSTAKEVTEVSGRGVGMDVVRRNLEKMQGRVEIDSEPGAGTTFRIFLPLTMAIIDGLLVRIGAGQYVIPTMAVRESLRPAADAVIEDGWGNGQLQHRGQSYPVLGLPHFLGLPKPKRSVRQTVVVLVEAGCAVFGLLVDELVGKQEIVIKTLEEPLNRNPVFAGAAILGDGRVGLVLEPRQLLEPAKIVAARVVAAAKSGTRPETSPTPKMKRNEEELAAL